ncbi:TusE/DsrC/DsvC family sulfur relay protein [Sedimenticola sp.]|uniref:TusE/DsrC/DsvC family sulfur relay protein n=1 Tax=Sedimenticola sp. TaxID=1940285 RepID=UPI00258FB217|nr:TusE/DsrC/DsvC family sulfur relay protein [Sedimenticola sp.]MCW8903817.1 TusE/DsrC/DsvC family sulfur relay protein [Sedimenticola sp.]
MTQFTINAQDTEKFSHYSEMRFAELADQSWDRKKSADLAQSEGISLTDEHWAVIVYLRRHYLDHGLPRNARTLAKILSQQFSALGGKKYLHQLFPGGPVTQGSRLGNLRTPANATDVSFGSSY